MTLQITKPELEALTKQRLQSGGFKDAEDVILQALRASSAKAVTTEQPGDAQSERSLREVFENARDLADDIDFTRNRSTGRRLELS